MRTCPVCKTEVEKADALFVDQTIEPQEYYHARCYEDRYGVNVYTKVETGYSPSLKLYYCEVCKHHHISGNFGKPCNVLVDQDLYCMCTNSFLTMGEYEASKPNPMALKTILGSTRNPWLNTILSKIAQLHDKKNHDYCPDDDNPFFNFEVAAKYRCVTQALDPNTVNATMVAFDTLLGVKLARLYALLTRGSQPNNEAFIDSEWDYVVYFLLRESYKLKLEEERKK